MAQICFWVNGRFVSSAEPLRTTTHNGTGSSLTLTSSPVNRRTVPVNTYMFDGPRPITAAEAGATGSAEDGREADGEMVRSAYTRRPNDDDFTQPADGMGEA